MSLRRVTSPTPQASGSPHLTRWNEFRAQPENQDAAVSPNWNGRCVGKWGNGGMGADVGVAFVNSQGSPPQVGSEVTQGTRVLFLYAGAAVGSYRTAFPCRGGTAGDFLYTDYRDSIFPRLAQPATFGLPLATVVEAWLRKVNNVDPTHCVTGFGFYTSPGNIGTNKGARIGIFGDGATGMRFGSIGAPDGVAAFVNLVGNEIDANSVQPASLVQPALNWFHVRLKLIPAVSATEPGRWAAYLNGDRVATFDLLANQPRGHDGVNQGYRSVVHGWTNGHAVGGQTNGLELRDFSMWQDEDLRL